MSVEALRALLPACATRGIPMLVANPDVVTVDAEMLVPMPGMLAQVSFILQTLISCRGRGDAGAHAGHARTGELHIANPD